MVSRILIKLIDYAIFPAVLIISVKILSIIFFAKYFSASYTVNNISLVFENAADFIAINSYSSLIMFAAVIAGLMWVTVKAHVFHETHITPSFSAKLFSMNLSDLIYTTETIYSQSFIWLSYAWLLTIIFGIHSYFSLSYWWVFYISLGASLIATALLAIDVERELYAAKSEMDDDYDDGSLKKMIKFEQLAEELVS